MSTAGFNGQNVTGQPYVNGPSQNPVGVQQLPAVNYGMTHQPSYIPMQAKVAAPPAPGPGLYPSGPYQHIPPVSSHQSGPPPPSSYPAPPNQPHLPLGVQQLPAVNYGMTHQPSYIPMQAKVAAPPAPGPGLYPSGPYQHIPPVSSHQSGPPPPSSYPAPPNQPHLPRPPPGGPASRTPPQSAGPSPGPRPPPARATPPPPPPAASLSGYYPNAQRQQQVPGWQYNSAPPPAGPPAAMNAPPRGSATNHVSPHAPYSSAPSPSMPQNAVQPPASLQGYGQPGAASPPMNQAASQQYYSSRAPYGPPPVGPPPPTMKPAAPPTANATPPPPKADGTPFLCSSGNFHHVSFCLSFFVICRFPSTHMPAQWGGGSTLPLTEPDGQEADVEPSGMLAGVGANHVDSKLAGPPQHIPPGHHLGHYPSLPPGYQQPAAPHGAPSTISHPAIDSATQPYSQAPRPYQQPPPGPGPAQLSPSLAAMSLQSSTPESLRVVNLLQERNLLPPGPVPAPTPCLPQDLQKMNCSPEVFRCTLTSIPQTQSLLNKAKMPLGLLLHPFKDLSHLPVVTSSAIVRCRSCRTYINPFVSFLDQRRWKCNLCYRVNDVPEEFMYNPVSRSYGEPHKRPEVQNATIEFIAPSEYMLRPPQPAVYLFVLDVSHNAVETGYLKVFCQSVLDNINALPGDARTKVGFITFDSTIHFYNLQEGLSQPQMLIVSDIEDIFLPTPDSLLVNLNESKELVQDLLKSLPTLFENTMETQSALGSALQAAFKLLSPTGGRLSIFQTQLPNLGVGALQSREDPNQRASAKDIQHLSPATDFYKKLALDCSGQQVAVDLFLLSSQYCDLASLGCISRYSAGSVYYFPSYHHQHNPAQVERFQKDLKRYLTRKIGFEAVMRIRCTKGLSIHTFHGNFFVRSTDLLSLPNVNPDAGYAVQMSIEENLDDMQVVSFQAALLYTSSKGERRIRVHTLCLPVVHSLSDIFAGADVQAMAGLLACMAVDRSVTASLSDARDAMTNAAIDSLSSYRQSSRTKTLSQKAFRTGTSTRLDDRVASMCQLKYQPLAYAMLTIHPALYRVDDLTDEGALNVNERTVPQPRVLQLSVEKLSREGAFLMDAGTIMYLWIGRNCNPNFLTQVLGVPSYAAVPDNLYFLPELDTAESQRTRAFVGWLREQRPFFPSLHIIRPESQLKVALMQNMIEDRTESALSYYEFLLHLQQQISK
ncbi:protein transport protein Sec24A [Hippocampus comes]|uniref:protein transport protein Sec24A n=1 Tax=Hippocampus comes TaxID=109280 RepID=UPI00094E3429|nr:PREDICTED: protein transport protein Sec24A [Hippocampus comes]